MNEVEDCTFQPQLVTYPVPSDINSRVGETIDPYNENVTNNNLNKLIYQSNEKICKSPRSKA